MGAGSLPIARTQYNYERIQISKSIHQLFDPLNFEFIEVNGTFLTMIYSSMVIPVIDQLTGCGVAALAAIRTQKAAKATIPVMSAYCTTLLFTGNLVEPDLLQSRPV